MSLLGILLLIWAVYVLVALALHIQAQQPTKSTKGPRQPQPHKSEEEWK